ncbi:hypothetical protein [Pseudomonas sp. Teo4]|uniref:hypothetical protein n=1 Tax=Pseudomonas sp. Teo4 TaxID=3064528 RepID=UPI002AB8F923|nr:hypothetical protein [Pseudomonas sp. Teo4]MDZ3993244.1 hypothetical protein [Pseudomonas sp. Teo4]
MTNQALPAQILDGNDRSKEAGFGEMDEAIAYDNPAAPGITLSRVYFNFELFDLYHSPHVHIQRRLIDAVDDGAYVGTADEILVWLRTTDVTLTQDSGITLEIDGKPLVIERASPEQRLHLLFVNAQAPKSIAEDVKIPLRIDGNASANRTFEVTPNDHLFVYGTPQFQARTLAQLAMPASHPELARLLDTAHQQYDAVPDIVLMQRHAGPPQQGPGFDLQRVIPAKYSHLLPGDYTVVLYDPYDSKASPD